MPRVPETQATVGPRPIPSVRQTPGATPEIFGAGVARETERLGGMVASAALEIQKREDAQAAMDAHREAEREWNDYLTGENGIFSRKGANAAGVTAEAKTKQKEISDRLAKKLRGNQRRMFDNLWQNTVMSSARSISTHQMVETRNSRIQSSEALAQGAIDTAYRMRTSDESIVAAEERMDLALISIGRELGWDTEKRNQMTKEYRSKMYASVVTGLVEDGNTERARAIMDRAISAGDLDSRIEEKLREDLRRKEDQVVAQNFSDEMLAKYPEDPAAALAEARKQFSGDREDEIVKRISALYSEKRAVKAMADQAEYENLGGRVLSMGNNLSAAREVAMNATSQKVREDLLSLVDKMITRQQARIEIGRANERWRHTKAEWARMEEERAKTTKLTPEQKQKLKKQEKDLEHRQDVAMMSVKLDFLEAIDNGTYRSRNALDLALAGYSLTEKQTQEIKDYFEQGGAKGGLTAAQMNEALKLAVNDDRAKITDPQYQGLWDLVKSNLEPGKPVNPESLRKTMARILAVQGGVSRSLVGKYSGTYMEALRKGGQEEADKWLPTLTESQKQEAARGIARIKAQYPNNPDVQAMNPGSDIELQRFYKYYILRAPVPGRKGQ